jgi:hypothetical protein
MRISSIVLNAIFGLSLPFFFLMSVFLTDDPNNPKRFTNGLLVLVALHAAAVIFSLVSAWRQRGVHNFRGAMWISWLPLITLLLFIAFVSFWAVTNARRDQARDQAYLTAPTTFIDPSRHYFVSADSTGQVFVQYRVEDKIRRASNIGSINDKSEFVFTARYAAGDLPGFANIAAAEEFFKSCRNSAGKSFLDNYKFVPAVENN